MSLTPQEQFKKFLGQSKNVLIFIPENPSASAVGSAWALYFYLEKRNIAATIAFSNHLDAKFNFLPRPKNIVTEITGARDFVLSFDTNRNKIFGIRQVKTEDSFNIYVTPEKGAIDPRDFSFILAKFRYDLAIVIDCQDLEKLGKLYSQNTDLFYEVPIINIDHRSENENFGQINLIDVLASSSAEIITNFILENSPDLIEKNIATCLLAGLIGATDSFQKKNTTPKSLSVAAMLMDRGADQQEIIRWLYKTQSLNMIKLWGRAMGKINWEEAGKTVWSALTVEDFVQSRSNPDNLPQVLEKLAENYSEGKFFMAVYNDTPETSIAIIKTADADLMGKIYPRLGGNIVRGVLELRFSQSNLEEIGKMLAGKIKELEAEK